jgi:antirestriction protein ArdC
MDKKQINIYQEVTDRFIELLTRGVIPWRQPWNHSGIPMNLLTKRPYRGVNTLLLASLGYEQNLFLTWHQIQDMGASVNKGEKGNLVVFTKQVVQDVIVGDATVKEKKQFLKYYKVFNIAQCSGIPVKMLPEFRTYESTSIEQCELVLQEYHTCPTIVHKGSAACYVPKDDVVTMPKKKSFITIEDYYHTLFHELIHSTGHSSRLNRKEVMENTSFGNDLYSFEELTAEIGAFHLSSYTGIADDAQFENSGAYIDAWIQKLQADNRIIIKASSAAQKSVDYILNRVESTENDISKEVRTVAA